MATVPATRDATTDDLTQQCPKCGADVTESELWRVERVCPACGHHATLGARERIAGLIDEGSFEEINQRLVSVDPLGFSDLQPYRERVQSARAKTGLSEAVVTG